MGKRQRYTVIVDFSRGSIKMAAAEMAGEAVRFHGITQISLPRDTESQEELDASEIASLIRREVKQQGWNGMRAACLLSGSATSTHSFLFPPMPTAEMRQAISLKLRDALHFDLGDASFDFRRVRTPDENDQGRVVTLVAAARRDAIRRAVTILREAGLQPTAIGAAAESLANLALGASLCHEDEATIHVDIGSESTILNMFDGHVLRFSREIDTAGNTFTASLMRPIIGPEGALRLTHEQAEELKVLAGCPLQDADLELPHGIKATDIAPLMEPVVQRLSAEIRRSIEYLGGLLGRPDVDRIVLSGSAGQMRNLDALLAESLGVPVEFNDPVARSIAHWRLAICEEQPDSPVSYSAILGYSLGGHQPINLLPREEKIERLVERSANVRKATAPLALALALALAVAAVPIDLTYGRASAAMGQTVRQLDECLRGEEELDAQCDAASWKAKSISRARGVVPDWVGIMKELSSLLAGDGVISSFKTTWSEGVPVIHLVVAINKGNISFARVCTNLTVSLSTSPFFGEVHVIDAYSAGSNEEGRLEVTIQVVAGLREPGGPSP